MKTIVSKTIITAIVAVCFSLNLLAAPANPALIDTAKKSKMSKMAPNKMAAPKMDKKKMAKDTGKMSKMSKM